MAIVRITRKFRFEMAHALLNYNGLCCNIHGHSYLLRVTIRGEAKKEPGSPDDGMVIDFGDLKKLIKTHIVDPLDHSLMVNSLIPADQLEALKKSTKRLHIVEFQPTTENISVYMAGILQQKLPPKARLFSLRLYETPNSYAEWHESDNV